MRRLQVHFGFWKRKAKDETVCMYRRTCGGDMEVNKGPIRFLKVSLAFVSVLCIAIFSFLAVYMSQMSSSTINEIGTIYMSGMNERISLHFKTTIDMRLAQVRDLKEDSPAGSKDTQELRDELAYNAEARGFDYLALYSREGEFEMIYGSPVDVLDLEPFLNSLNKGEDKIAVGNDANGNKITLLGVSAEYSMEDGECTALVAGLPVSYIQEALFLDEEESLVYSHIIRRDGSFVIRSGDAFRENYFERLRSVFDEVGGENAEWYVAELKEAMNKGRDYSAVLDMGTERRHLYCTRLPYSEWYLVTVMPYGSLDRSIRELSSNWVVLTLGGCAIVLLSLAVVFLKYFGFTRKQLHEVEEARREAVYANKAKSEFLSNMSHDIRTPMNAIVGMTAIATANIDDHKQVQNCLRKITLSSKHLLGLINDVLDMSKIESGKMTLNIDQISLREVMESIVSIVQPQIKAKNQKFDVFIHDIFAENVYCDSVRLNQVLLNFLSNAIKFTPEEGEIQISVWEEPSLKGSAFVRIHLLVKDNGIGMSPEFREKIFESFTREDSARVRKTQGTGLGMAITKYIVDAMGGTIEVASEQGKGSEFHVILDLEQADIAETEMLLPDWNMLVVDDDEQLCRSTVDALESIGVRAEWTLDGESAVALVEKRHKEHNDYQVILLDWKLPGMDGVRTAQAIRKLLGENIPILLISAYDWSEIEKEAKEAGVNGFICKPLFKSTLFYGLRHYAGQEEERQDLEEEKFELSGKRILLAEDNDLNWEIAEELFSEEGLKLERAENGQICVEMFQKSEEGYYDAILMDIRMPVMTGYEAAWAIRKLDRGDSHLPIIAMTADAFSEDVKRCLDCGMNAHVAKPIDVQEVMRLLVKFIEIEQKEHEL